MYHRNILTIHFRYIILNGPESEQNVRYLVRTHKKANDFKACLTTYPNNHVSSLKTWTQILSSEDTGTSASVMALFMTMDMINEV